jgi:hypothetical protein
MELRKRWRDEEKHREETELNKLHKKFLSNHSAEEVAIVAIGRRKDAPFRSF